MQDESGPRTLQPTALLHEAWLKLAGADAPTDPSALRAAASVAMRHVRIDAARRRRAQSRDVARSVELRDTEAQTDEPCERDAYVIALDAALDRLEQQLPELARLVELRFFLGLDLAEIGDELQWSTRTVKRRWQMARGWLHREIQKELARD